MLRGHVCVERAHVYFKGTCMLRGHVYVERAHVC